MDGFGTYYFLKIFLNIPIVWNLEVNADSDRIEFVFVYSVHGRTCVPIGTIL